MPGKPTTIFRASLQPKLYRDIEIEATKSLYDLAAAIVSAFGFDLDHAFGFYSNLKGNYGKSPRKYELFADMGEGDPGDMGVEATPMATAFPRIGAKMLFLFDYGDDWRFNVEMIGVGEKVPWGRYPKVLSKVGDAPIQYPAYDDDAE